MTAEELQETRSNAVESPIRIMPRRPESGMLGHEFIERLEDSAACFYAVRDGVVSAVIVSWPIDGKSEPHYTIARNVSAYLREHLTRQGVDGIARANSELVYSEIGAERWRETASELDAYFVSTNEETTLVVFDPTKLDLPDLFVTANQISTLEARVRELRAIAGREIDRNIPILQDRPWENQRTNSVDRELGQPTEPSPLPSTEAPPDSSEAEEKNVVRLDSSDAANSQSPGMMNANQWMLAMILGVLAIIVLLVRQRR